MQDKLKDTLPNTIKYSRNIPKRGPSGLLLFTAAFTTMTIGWYFTLKTNKERRELKAEKAYARINLVALLQAETDRDMVRRLEAANRVLEDEAGIELDL